MPTSSDSTSSTRRSSPSSPASAEAARTAEATARPAGSAALTDEPLADRRGQLGRAHATRRAGGRATSCRKPGAERRQRTARPAGREGHRARERPRAPAPALISPASGSPSTSATTSASSPLGAGPRTSSRTSAQWSRTLASTRVAAAAARSSAGHHEQRHVGELERHPRRVDDVARQVDHDELAATQPRVEQGRHGLRGHVAPSVRPQDRTLSSSTRGSDAVQRVGGQPPSGAVEVAPAQPLLGLSADHEVDASAERVAVDQQGAVAEPQAGHRQRGGRDRRPRTTATADDGDQRAASAAGDRLGEPVDQPRLAVGQDDHVLGADVDRPPPDPGVVEVTSDEDDVGPPGQAGGGDVAGQVVTHQHQRGAGHAARAAAADGSTTASAPAAATRRSRLSSRTGSSVRISGRAAGGLVTGALRMVVLPEAGGRSTITRRAAGAGKKSGPVDENGTWGQRHQRKPVAVRQGAEGRTEAETVWARTADDPRWGGSGGRRRGPTPGGLSRTRVRGRAGRKRPTCPRRYDPSTSI